MTNRKRNILIFVGLTVVGLVVIVVIPIISFLFAPYGSITVLALSKMGLILGKLTFLPILIFIALSFALLMPVIVLKEIKLKKVILLWLLVMILSWGFPNAIYHHIYLKQDQLNLGPNPFNEREIMKPRANTLFWQSEFWLSKEKRIAKLTAERKEKDQNSRLIKFIEKPEPLDISFEKAIAAFGEPAQKKEVESGFTEWIYYPWEDNEDWTLPVYFKDNKLWSIGKILTEAEREQLRLEK